MPHIINNKKDLLTPLTLKNELLKVTKCSKIWTALPPEIQNMNYLFGIFPFTIFGPEIDYG